MFKKVIIPVMLFILVIAGCVIVNIKNTESLSPYGNFSDNYEVVTEEFGEDFSEFIKDKANVKIYVDEDNDTAEMKVGDKIIKFTKNNIFIVKIKAIGNFFTKQINNIENSLNKMTENIKENKKSNEKIDTIVDDFLKSLQDEN